MDMNNCCRSSLNNILSDCGCNSCCNQNSNTSNSGNCNNNQNSNTSNNCVNENLLDALCNCVGRRCTCEFDTSDGLESKSGVLERIGNNFLLLRSVNNNRVMYCSTCNLMFVTIMC